MKLIHITSKTKVKKAMYTGYVAPQGNLEFKFIEEVSEKLYTRSQKDGLDLDVLCDDKNKIYVMFNNEKPFNKTETFNLLALYGLTDLLPSKLVNDLHFLNLSESELNARFVDKTQILFVSTIGTDVGLYAYNLPELSIISDEETTSEPVKKETTKKETTKKETTKKETTKKEIIKKEVKKEIIKKDKKKT